MKEKNKIRKTEIDKELKQISPTLASIEKSNPFVVDNDYFEKLYSNIQDNISKESDVVSLKQKAWFLRPQYSYSIAAAVLILVAFAINYFSNYSDNNQNNIEKTQIAKDNSSIIKNQNSNKEDIKKEQKQSGVDEINSKESTLIVNEENIDNPLHKSPSKILQENSIYQDNLNKQKNNPNYADNNNGTIQKPGSSTSNPIKPDITNQANLAKHNPSGNKPVNNDSADDVIKQTQNIYKKPIVDLGEDICSNHTVEIIAGNTNKRYSYQWSTGAKTSSINVSKTGKYTVTVSLRDKPEVYSVDNIQVKIIEKPIVNLGTDQTICSNEKLTLYATENNNNNDYSYKWLPNGETSSFIQLEKLSIGIHKLKVTVSGCENYTDEILITVNECQLEIPNVFTPNGDGVNDYFKINGLENYPKSKLFIFDRNGHKVYESLNYLNNWNGSNSPDGVYFFKLFISDDKQTLRQGSITLYRK